MNTERQIVQILQKDLRAHPLEIGLLLLMNLFLVFMATAPWSDNLLSADEYIGGAFELVLQLAFVLMWCLLIAQVIQADTPMGKASYWLTRPLSRLAIPAAKAAFVLLVVHLPSFAAQLIIVIASGVPLSIPQLLLNQVVVLLYLSLPAMLIASLTRSLSQFVLAFVCIAALVVMMQAGILGGASVPEVAGDLLDPIPIEVAAWMLVLGLVSGAALFWQYRKRRALVVASCCAGILVPLNLIAAAIPGSVEHWSRTLLYGTSTEVPEISFRPSAERPVVVENVPIGFSRLSLPLEISKSGNVEFLNTLVRVRMLTGTESTFENPGYGLWPRSDGYRIDVSIPQYFMESELSIRMVIDSVQFEISDGEAIPLNGRPVIVDGHAQCGHSLIGSGPSGYVLCRSSFGRWEWYMVPGQRIATGRDLFLPFRFAINPIMEYRVVPLSRPTDDAMTLPAQVRAASGFFRQVVEIDRIRPQDWITE
jgi:ABC-type transport system involved in multi-copper enzyme maturation permease subunit